MRGYLIDLNPGAIGPVMPLLARHHVQTKTCVAGQRGPNGCLAEAGRSLGQPEA